MNLPTINSFAVATVRNRIGSTLIDKIIKNIAYDSTIWLMYIFGSLSRQVGDFLNCQEGALQRHNLLCLPVSKVYRPWRNKGPKQYINPSIYSDSRKSYQTNRIEIKGFLNAKVNHKYNFSDPDTGVHTQIIQRM